MGANAAAVARSPGVLRSTAQSCLCVTIGKGGRPLARIFSPSGLVRWGPKGRSEFVYPVPGVAGAEPLFVRRRGGVRLLLRDGMTGELRVGESRLAVECLGAWGLPRGSGPRRGVDLTPEMSGQIEFL